MKNDELSYLEEVRDVIDKYLFLGYAPSTGTPGHDKSVQEMEDALKKPEFAAIRRKYNQMKSKAKVIIDRCGINAVLVMGLPVAAGGGSISSHILDLVTDNVMWQRLDKQKIFDIIDETIGQIEMGVTKINDLESRSKNVFISHGPETKALKKLAISGILFWKKSLKQYYFMLVLLILKLPGVVMFLKMLHNRAVPLTLEHLGSISKLEKSNFPSKL